MTKKPVNSDADSDVSYVREQDEYIMDDDDDYVEETAESIIRDALKNATGSTASTAITVNKSPRTAGFAKRTGGTPMKQKGVTRESADSTPCSSRSSKPVSRWVIDPSTLPALPQPVRKNQLKDPQPIPHPQVDTDMQDMFGDDESDNDAGPAETSLEGHSTTESSGPSQSNTGSAPSTALTKTGLSVPPPPQPPKSAASKKNAKRPSTNKSTPQPPTARSPIPGASPQTTPTTPTPACSCLAVLPGAPP